MKNMLRIAGFFLIVILVIVAVLIFVFYYRNMHWYEKYEKAILKAGAQEKQVTLPNGNTINYGEVENDKPALLLIHGQMGQWESYALCLEKLSEKWHIYAVDVYGHGQSTHDENLYYIDVNANDLIWFIDNVIGEKTFVAGHSNGALTAAYIAAYGSNVAGACLEDPPVFSTEQGEWERSFAYINTYKPLHEYDQSDKKECIEVYLLRNGYFGKQYGKLSDMAQRYHEKHPDEVVKIGFLPSVAWSVNQYLPDYDLNYGEHFYDLTWNHGFTHRQILSDIRVPSILIHEKENIGSDGVYLCATSDENARKAVSCNKDNITLIEVESSFHDFHSNHTDEFVNIINSMNP